MHCIFVLTILQLLHIANIQHRPDFMSCMWGGLHQVHILCLQCVCSPCKRCRSSFHTGVCHWSVAVYYRHNIYPLFWFQLQTLILKMLFQYCDSFLRSPVMQSFIDVLHHFSYMITNILNAMTLVWKRTPGSHCQTTTTARFKPLTWVWKKSAPHMHWKLNVKHGIICMRFECAWAHGLQETRECWMV